MGFELTEWSRYFAMPFSAHFALHRNLHPYMCLKLAEVSLYAEHGSADVSNLLDKADSYGIPRTGFVRACILLDNCSRCGYGGTYGAGMEPYPADTIQTAVRFLRESADLGCIDSAEALLDMYDEG